jgi:transposase-like protein
MQVHHRWSYPPEFRRKVLDLLAAGRSVTDVADDLGISGACVYNLRKQDRIDRGEMAGPSTSERTEALEGL